MNFLDDPEAIYRFGLDLLSRKRPGDAEKTFRKAIAVRPRFAEARGRLADLLRERGETEEALTHYRAAVAAAPAYVEARIGLAGLLRARGDRDEAAVHYRVVVEAVPDFAEGHFLLASLLRELGDEDGALAHFRAAVAAAPDYIDALFGLGRSLEDRGDPGEALDAYHQAWTVAPLFLENAVRMLFLARRCGRDDLPGVRWLLDLFDELVETPRHGGQKPRLIWCCPARGLSGAAFRVRDAFPAWFKDIVVMTDARSALADTAPFDAMMEGVTVVHGGHTLCERIALLDTGQWERDGVTYLFCTARHVADSAAGFAAGAWPLSCGEPASRADREEAGSPRSVNPL